VKELIGALTLITGLAIVGVAAASAPATAGSGAHAAPVTKAEPGKPPSAPAPAVKH
jgi:hypothetical protein